MRREELTLTLQDIYKPLIFDPITYVEVNNNIINQFIPEKLYLPFGWLSIITLNKKVSVIIGNCNVELFFKIDVYIIPRRVVKNISKFQRLGVIIIRYGRVTGIYNLQYNWRKSFTNQISYILSQMEITLNAFKNFVIDSYDFLDKSEFKDFPMKIYLR